MPTASKKNEPDTPGSTRAHTAIAANKIICHQLGFPIPAFGNDVSQKAIAAPARMATPVVTLADVLIILAGT